MAGSIKYVALVTLTVQNSMLILLMHYSRVMPGYTDETRYRSSTAVLLNEVFKLVLSLAIALYSSGFRATYEAIVSPGWWKLSVPAALYTLQNSLQYTAVSCLDAATFQVAYQFKIVTTAFFTVLILRRTLSMRRWFALFVLMFGIAIIQIPDKAASHNSDNLLLGMISVGIACFLSGLAGVYLEQVMKESAASLWVRNIQLSFFSLIPSILAVCGKDGSIIAARGFFAGYNAIVWSTILVQAIGGLLVALCMVYADSILKNFSTGFSIILSCIGSVYLFDFTLTGKFAIGTILTLVSTWLYNSGTTKTNNNATSSRPVLTSEEFHEKQQLPYDSKSGDIEWSTTEVHESKLS